MYSISSVAQCFQGMSFVDLLCTSQLAFVLGAHLLCGNETFRLLQKGGVGNERSLFCLLQKGGVGNERSLFRLLQKGRVGNERSLFRLLQKVVSATKSLCFVCCTVFPRNAVFFVSF